MSESPDNGVEPSFISTIFSDDWQADAGGCGWRLGADGPGTKKPAKQSFFAGFWPSWTAWGRHGKNEGGRQYWIRTSDLYDVNVAL